MKGNYCTVLRIRDVYPVSWFLTHHGSRIPDHGSRIQKQQQKRGAKICHTFFCSYKFHTIVNYFIFEMLKKKIWANFQRILELFTQKIVTELSKIWVWIRDPRSGIRDLEKTYSGSRRIRGSKRHRIPDPGSGSATLYCSMHSMYVQYLRIHWVL